MKKTNGFAAFIALFVIAVVAGAIALSVTYSSINTMNTALAYGKGIEVSNIGESCIDEALLRLRDISGYAGETMTVGNGSCVILVTGTGANRTITVTATLPGPPNYVIQYMVTAKRAGGNIRVISFQKQ